jgi:hypothetical protein
VHRFILHARYRSEPATLDVPRLKPVIHSVFSFRV